LGEKMDDFLRHRSMLPAGLCTDLTSEGVGKFLDVEYGHVRPPFWRITVTREGVKTLLGQDATRAAWGFMSRQVDEIPGEDVMGQKT
jgi:hypothetical protein